MTTMGVDGEIRTDGLSTLTEIGRLGVITDGRWQAISGECQARIVATLSVHRPRSVSIDRLVDTVWPAGDAPATAAQSLRNAVARLRALLGPSSIVAERGGYRLGESVRSQRAQFLEQAAVAEDATSRRQWAVVVAAAEQCERLWGGDPWSDIDLLVEIEADRAHLRGRRRAVGLLAAEACLALGQHERASCGFRDLLIEDPTNERVWAGLARARAGLGSRVEAIRAIDEARRQLARSGLEISPTLRAVEADLLAPTDSRPHTRRHHRNSRFCGHPPC